jgi:hypothetical protein
MDRGIAMNQLAAKQKIVMPTTPMKEPTTDLLFCRWVLRKMHGVTGISFLR